MSLQKFRGPDPEYLCSMTKKIQLRYTLSMDEKMRKIYGIVMMLFLLMTGKMAIKTTKHKKLTLGHMISMMSAVSLYEMLQDT